MSSCHLFVKRSKCSTGHGNFQLTTGVRYYCGKKKLMPATIDYKNLRNEEENGFRNNGTQLKLGRCLSGGLSFYSSSHGDAAFDPRVHVATVQRTERRYASSSFHRRLQKGRVHPLGPMSSKRRQTSTRVSFRKKLHNILRENI